jgi:prevent-host-death family protein
MERKMKTEDLTTSLGHLVTHADQLLDEVQHSHLPVIITRNGEPRAVLQDIESYERQRDALIMLQVLAHWKHEVKTQSDNSQIVSPKRGMAKAESKNRRARKAS